MAVGSIGSGFDADALVKKLVSARRDDKVKLYDNKIEGYDTKLSALGTINSAVDDFSKSVGKINNSMIFSGHNVLIDQSQDSPSLAVEAGGAAANGQYDIGVLQTAKGSRVVSSSGQFSSKDAVVAEYGGKLKISAGDKAFTVDVAPKSTLADLRSQINDDSGNFGVSANLIDDGKGNVFFTIGSSIEGDGNTLEISNTQNPPPKDKIPVSDSLDKTEQEAYKTTPLSKDILSLDSVSSKGPNAALSIPDGGEAQDAIITIDGVKVYNDSNTFDDTIPGLTITSTDVTEQPQRVEVTSDKKTVEESVQNFVQSYNNLENVLSKNDARGAVLNGSSLIRGLKSSMSSSLMATRSEPGQLNSVFDLGLQLERNGKLTLNSQKFDKALNENFSEVSGLFAGEQGLGKRFTSMLDNYTGIRGMGRTMQNTLQESKRDTQETLGEFEEHIKKYESSLRDKFSRLDTQLSNMKSQGNYLNSMLAGMN